MDLYKATSKTLWGGAVLGIAITAIGLMVNMLGHGEGVLWAGLLILILSPIIGVMVSAVFLLLAKDYAWASVALILIAMTAVSIMLTMYLN
ncbi:MAG: hypothetical protein ACOX1N_01605 [Candidatus Methanomethylophilaceae archaeon]|jgi:hypothetical protein